MPVLSLTLQQLADCCNAHLEGDSTFVIEGVSNLLNAKESWASIYTDKRHFKDLETTNAGVIISTIKLAKDHTKNKIIVADPHLALAKILALFVQRINLTSAPRRITNSARISKSAHIGENVSLGAFVVIGQRVKIANNVVINAGCVIEDDVIIGEQCKIDSNVTIYQRCTLGKRCHISSGSVIGADGFGFAKTSENTWLPIPQISRVCIGDDVHIGANTTIDCGSLEDTVIEDGVIIDNLVQIGHNVTIGKHTAIAACTAIAGSSQIGQHCQIAGMVAIAGHLKITDQVTIFGDSCVTKSIDQPGVYGSTIPVMPIKKWRRVLAKIKRLPITSDKNNE